MRELFQLPYRNTEGFGRWVFRMKTCFAACCPIKKPKQK
jgi:hypothetical protein